ncbi:MAG: response regulator [Thiomargarita sp.]|nr:response regulator [Thiomargarita sp.]
MQILLVEDNVTNQKVVRLMLKKLGYQQLEVANNGEEAVNMTAAKTYDIVFMDMQMPVMDGLEATKAIRQREEKLNQNRLTIIAMTAHAMGGDRESCIAAGMDDYINKPIKRNILAEVFERLQKATPS